MSELFQKDIRTINFISTISHPPSANHHPPFTISSCNVFMTLYDARQNSPKKKYYKISDLRRRNPEALYHALCNKTGKPVDRCVLYVFRCAVYFASHAKHDPEKLKWWNWKDS